MEPPLLPLKGQTITPVYANRTDEAWFGRLGFGVDARVHFF